MISRVTPPSRGRGVESGRGQTWRPLAERLGMATRLPAPTVGVRDLFSHDFLSFTAVVREHLCMRSVKTPGAGVCHLTEVFGPKSVVFVVHVELVDNI